MKLFSHIRNNSMVDYLVTLRGNPKACICCEPMWYIPYSLYSPFATVYMLKLGVTDLQIGYLLSIGMVFQVLASFFGGILTDKLGRRLTTLLADLTSWSLPCLIWAFSQNFWWFLATTVFNSIWQVSNISWTALLVEDCDNAGLVYAFSWIQTAGLLAVFISPVSYALLNRFDTVTVVRGLYLFTFVSMTAKFVVLYLFSHETRQGLVRMQQTRHQSVGVMLAGYKTVLGKIVRSGQMRFALFIMLVYNIINTAVVNFFGVYTTTSLQISEGMLSIFPMVRAAIMLGAMFTVQTKLNRLPFRPVMIGGCLVFLAAHVLLLLTPAGNTGLLFVYSFLEAFALICIVPRKDSLSSLFIDSEERSRVTALLYMFMIGVTSPFGSFIGWLSSVNRAYPFIMNIVLLLVLIVSIFCSKELKKLDAESAGA